MSFVLSDIDIHNEEVSFARWPRSCCSMLFVYVDAVKGLPDPQHGRELVVYRCVASMASCVAALHVSADPAHSLRSRFIFYCCDCPVCVVCVSVLKGNNRMRFAGHNNNHLCPVTSCHISCMINELILACPFSPQHSQAAAKREHIR